MSLLDIVTGCWAIAPERLQEIRAIYKTHLRGEKIDIQAIEARLGRPMQAEAPSYTLAAGGIAVVEASGVIAPKANLFMAMSGGVSAQILGAQIRAAGNDASARGLVLSLDSPGGNVLGVPEVAEALAAVAKIKPTAVHSEGQLASAGYWIGAAANAVYVSGPLVQVGSIGVVVSRKFDPTAAEQEETITAGKYKRIANSREPLSADSRALVQADVDYVYSIFVDHVAAMRGVTPTQVLEHMADGLVFRGQQAIDAGLVDGVSTLDALVELMATRPEQFKTRRPARIVKGAAPSKSTGAGAALGDETSQPRKGNSMNAITRESLQADHADVYNAIRQEGHAEGLAAGAAAERDRIKGVREQLVPGHEALVEGLAFDGKTTAAEAAMQVNAAVRATVRSAGQAHASDAPAALNGSAAPTDKAVKSKAEKTEEAKAYAAEHGVDFFAAIKTLGYDK